MTHPTLDIDAWDAAVTDPAIVIVDGNNASIAVRNGQLQIEDGVPSNRRTRTISRIPRTVARVVLLGRVGYITFEAMRWMRDAGVTFVHLDNGEIMRGGRFGMDSRILKAQIAQVKRPDIVRTLLANKLEGQAYNAGFMGMPDLQDMMREYSRRIRQTDNVKVMRGYEGKSGEMYWRCWKEGVQLPENRRYPAHWERFSGRESHAGERGNRYATDPINAMLNFAYLIAETEATNACWQYDLSPVIGYLHVDATDRNSLALDLMEPVRPLCDRLVLEILPEFNPRWCHEERNGVVRLDPPLTHRIAGWAPQFARDIRPYAEYIHIALKGGRANAVAKRDMRIK